MTNQPKFGEWIKCSERLPEVGVDVLVYNIEKSMSFYCLDRDEIETWWYAGARDFPLSFVTHWTPLPEAPNE
jgi:hypothetical protein